MSRPLPADPSWRQKHGSGHCVCLALWCDCSTNPGKVKTILLQIRKRPYPGGPRPRAPPDPGGDSILRGLPLSYPFTSFACLLPLALLPHRSFAYIPLVYLAYTQKRPPRPGCLPPNSGAPLSQGFPSQIAFVFPGIRAIVPAAPCGAGMDIVGCKKFQLVSVSFVSILRYRCSCKILKYRDSITNIHLGAEKSGGFCSEPDGRVPGSMAAIHFLIHTLCTPYAYLMHTSHPRKLRFVLQQFSALTITRLLSTLYPNFRYRSWASLVIRIPRRPLYSGRDSIYDTSAVPSPIC